MQALTVLCLSAFIALSLSQGDGKLPFLKNGGKHWALIVAGSNGYYNYRHQADVCHAFHVLKDHGIPEENIIVMMYDDIANNEENPDKGVLINRPKGENVYEGVKIDYKGKHVTPEVFLAALKGEKQKLHGKGTGRVIESGPDDHIFVNFVDHGAPGLVAFPDSELHARTFIKALKSMHENKQYSQMVIYVEACESGSMFKGLLPDNINIYATTAANGKESSYATYYDEHLKTFLGDLYSVKWMENSDVANLNKESLISQFEVVKKETNKSHVQEFGDMSMGKEPVGDFQGNHQSDRNIYYEHIDAVSVPTHDTQLYILHDQIAKAKSEQEKGNLTVQLLQEFKDRDTITTEMKHIVAFALNHDHIMVGAALATRTEQINFDCYEPSVMHYTANCRKFSQDPFAMRVLYALQNVCNTEDMTAETVISAIDKVC